MKVKCCCDSVGADDERCGAKRNKHPWGIGPIENVAVIDRADRVVRPYIMLPIVRCTKASLV